MILEIYLFPLCTQGRALEEGEEAQRLPVNYTIVGMSKKIASRFALDLQLVLGWDKGGEWGWGWGVGDRNVMSKMDKWVLMSENFACCTC